MNRLVIELQRMDNLWRKYYSNLLNGSSNEMAQEGNKSEIRMIYTIFDFM